MDLSGHARFGDATAAMRTLVRKRNVNNLINSSGRLTMTMATVAPTGLTADWPRMRPRRALRKRRRLPLAGTPRRRELLPQLLVLTLQPFARLLRLLELPSRAINFSIEILER